MQRNRRPGASATAALLLGVALAVPQPALAEQAWVRDEIRLNLRSGPGNNYRIFGALKTGDEVSVLKRAEKWTQVSSGADMQGWIPAGYLLPEPPAAVRLVKIEEEVVELRGQLEALGAQRARLSASNERLAGADMEQTQQIDELSRENDQLKGDQRWPEWITGAGVLCVGMILGALWSRSSGRRARPRIKL